MNKWISTILSLAALTLVGCSAAQIKSDLVKRASFDLSCSEQELQLTILSKMSACGGDEYHCAQTVGVTGCAKKATYVRTDSGGGPTWVRNSEVQQEPTPKAP